MRKSFFTALLLVLFCFQMQASVRVVIPEDMPVVYDVDTDRGYAVANHDFRSATSEQLNREDLYIRDEVEYDGVSYPVTRLCDGFYDLFAAIWEPQKPVSPKSIRLPAPLKSIGNKAFYRCDKLEEIFIPSEVESIGEDVFIWASNLKKVFNASRSIELGEKVALGGAKNADVYEVDTIGQTDDFRYYTFDSLRYIFDIPETEHLVIPEGYQVGKQMCYQWISLKTVSLPSDIQFIGKRAFYECKNLERVEGLGHVTSIPDEAFYRCRNLQEAPLSPELQHLGEFAFCDCSSLKSIELCDSITKIGIAAFSGCESLTYVRLPQDIKVLPVALFHSCSSLTEIQLPENLRIIKNQCFEFCTSLTSIHFPDSLEEIGFMSFWGCKELTEIDIPSNVKRIQFDSFKDCTSLERVHLSAEVTRLEGDCFDNCANLRYLTCDALTPPTANNSCFKGIPYYKCEVTVPEGSEDAYRNADGWHNFRLFNEEWDLAIDAVMQDAAPDAPAFDLMGRKMDPENSHKGLMIKNGALQIIR